MGENKMLTGRLRGCFFRHPGCVKRHTFWRQLWTRTSKIGGLANDVEAEFSTETGYLRGLVSVGRSLILDQEISANDTYNGIVNLCRLSVGHASSNDSPLMPVRISMRLGSPPSRMT